MATIAERFKRWLTPTEEPHASDPRDLAEAGAAQKLGDCPMRAKVTLRGCITTITTDQRAGRLEAELSDGSGTVRLVWMGRTRLACLSPGATLRVTGRLTQDQDQPVIYNPSYEVLAVG